MLPPIFKRFQNLVTGVRKATDNEWSSSCPSCGTVGHEGNEPSDRCRWLIVGHAGKPIGFCRKCGKIFWPDAKDLDADPLSEAEMESWRVAAIEKEQSRIRSAQRALDHLREVRVWEQYWEHMDEIGRNWWHERGLSDCFIDWWELGWKEDWSFRQEDGVDHVTPSASIPIFGKEGEILNVKHRFVYPPPNRSKYQYQFKGLGKTPLAFLTNHELTLDGHVILCEGEIKSMVVYQTLDDVKAKVVGTPGATPSKAMAAMLDEADRITYIIDPDAKPQAWRFIKLLGKDRVRVFVPPGDSKIDDAILASGLTKRELSSAIRNATPC